MNDCIVAIATPLVGSIHHIIRGSGKDAFVILKSSFDLNIEMLLNTRQKIIHLDVPAGINIIVYLFYEPYSYTGENMFEIHLWGNYVIACEILEKLLRNGAVTAKEGEFTKRALFNGKKNLLEVEHLSNLYASFSSQIVKLNHNILHSKTNQEKLRNTYNLLLDIVSELEASWDFVEYDIPAVNFDKAVNDLKNIYTGLCALLNNVNYFDTHAQGFKIAIWGLPNAGKSFIFKRLTGYMSIIAGERGTTRDIISATKRWQGITFTFLDMPGYDIMLKSEVEKLSSQVVRDILPHIDGIIFVFDLSSKEMDLEFQCYEKVKNKVVLIAANKMDICNEAKKDSLLKVIDGKDIVFVSALKNKGFGSLLQKLSKKFLQPTDHTDYQFVSQRQYLLLNEIKNSLENAIKHFEDGTPVDIIVDELKYSLQNLESLFGIRLDEEILTNIMSKFCVGK
ncbi:MAG: GTP-binding protein [Planctomycetota bacterium]